MYTQYYTKNFSLINLFFNKAANISPDTAFNKQFQKHSKFLQSKNSTNKDSIRITSEISEVLF